MRHRPSPFGIALGSFVLVAALLPTLAASATTGTMSITTDTTLMEDHFGQIQIAADGITLDCAGHEVVGPAAPSELDIGIQVHFRSGVTVRNCDVSGFAIGISLHDTENTTIDSNTLHDNVTGDVPVGIALNGASGNVISANVASDNAGDGIAVQVSAGDSTGNTLVGNTVTGNGRYGIILRSASGNVVKGNSVMRNTLNGIHLISDANLNTIADNEVRDNGLHGLTAYSSEQLTVTNNTVSGNGTGGEDGHGMKIRLTGGSVFRGNTASHNLVSGFFTDGIGNTFTSNEAHRNGDFGIDDDAVGGASAYASNSCTANASGGSEPSGLCQEEQVGLVDSASGEWHLRHDATDVTSFYFGNPGDVPFLADWDCDGVATPGLFRQSDAFAYLRNSNSQGIADIRFFFGNPSDIPLAGDFNGDGCDTLSIYRPENQTFYIMNELGENEGGLGAAEYSFVFGNPGDNPVVGDWDGDGIDEIGLHRETTGFFYYRDTLTTGVADGEMFFGDPGDRFIAGDWGIVDGKETPGVFRPSNSTFYFRHTLDQGVADHQFEWTGAGAWPPIAGPFGG